MKSWIWRMLKGCKPSPLSREQADMLASIKFPCC